MDKNSKKPVIKNIIKDLQLLISKKTQAPAVLYTSSMNNQTRRNLARTLFKEKGPAVESDLNALFNFLTSPSHRYLAASEKGKILSKEVSALYNKHGKESGFETELDFYIALSLHIGDRVKSRVIKIDAKSEEEDESKFTAGESFHLEYFRNQLLSQIASPENLAHPQYGFLFQVAQQELSTCSLSKVKSFAEAMQQNRERNIQSYEQRIDALKQKQGESLLPDISIKYLTEILNYYKGTDLAQSSFVYMINQNLLRRPDALLTNSVDKQIDTSLFASDIHLLQNINNLIVCMQTGLLSNDIFFNGRQFVCQNPKFPMFPFTATNASRVVRELPELKRDNQSMLAYNEDYVQRLLQDKKYPITKVSLPSEEGQVRELTLYSTQVVQDEKDLQECAFPLFVKSLTTNEANNSSELILYAVSAPGISVASQICRIDKVPPCYHGKASVHKQISGEILETNTHIHGYNLFDKVINTSTKNAGHFDIALNFNLDQQVTNEQLEAFFDSWCGLPNNDAVLDTFMEENSSFRETTRLLNRTSPPNPEDDLSALLPYKIIPPKPEEDLSVLLP